MVDNRERILALARNAPLLPIQVSKSLGVNSLIASAMLSELVSKGQLKVSNIKVGSSPLYYHPDHADQLQNYVSYLNSKDKQAYEFLKEKRVVRENVLDPLMRVAVKSIKDFSRPLEVTFGNTKEIFWKWYLLPDSDAEPIIKQLLDIGQKDQMPKPEKSVQHEIPQPDPRQLDKKVAASQEHPVSEAAAAITDQQKAVRQRRLVERPVEVEKIRKPAEKESETDLSDAFFKRLLKFFQKNNITVFEQKVVRKKADYEFVIGLESPVGLLTYFCKAKNKKRVSEADISSAFVQGQLKKLPVILLAPGDMTRQAQEMSKELKGVAVKKLDGS